MSDALVELHGVAAGYDGVPVVRDLDLAVAPGEVVALLGPNGAGKTTTLLTISGLVKPLAGSVVVLGAPVVGIRPHRVARRGVAHVPEGRSLFYELTVAENLRLGLTSARAGRRDAIERATGFFPALEPLMARKAGVLSGGEQQMLAMARALVSEPKLLLLDEMSLGLAPVIVEALLPVVRRIADETRCGVLLVEQHVEMALEVADHAVIMSNGRVTLRGPAIDLAGRRDLLEASYLGEQGRPPVAPDATA